MSRWVEDEIWSGRFGIHTWGKKLYYRHSTSNGVQKPGGQEKQKEKRDQKGRQRQMKTRRRKQNPTGPRLLTNCGGRKIHTYIPI